MMPHGYTGCILVSLIPYCWFKVANPLVDAAASNKKVTDEVMSQSLSWSIPTLMFEAVVATYVVFVVNGFKM